MEKKTRMFNQGMYQHRFENNPIERVLAEQWDQINCPPDTAGTRTLEHMLTVDGHQYVEYPQRVLAATLIQWLGSTIGQGFLKDCGFIHKREFERRACLVVDFETQVTWEGAQITVLMHPLPETGGWAF